ncbi:hypothetical protein C0J52_09431 [Blattella germanica]|nr:hypothetical protein C0J52_09431 [Blattella germanica]
MRRSVVWIAVKNGILLTMDCWQASSWRLCSAWMFLLVLDLTFDVSDSTSQSEVNKHLEMGRDLLSRGQLQDALSHYHAAVDYIVMFSKYFEPCSQRSLQVEMEHNKINKNHCPSY